LFQFVRPGEIGVSLLFFSHHLVGIPTLAVEPGAARVDPNGLIVMKQCGFEIALVPESLSKAKVGVAKVVVPLKTRFKVGNRPVKILYLQTRHASLPVEIEAVRIQLNGSVVTGQCEQGIPRRTLSLCQSVIGIAVFWVFPNASLKGCYRTRVLVFLLEEGKTVSGIGFRRPRRRSASKCPNPDKDDSKDTDQCYSSGNDSSTCFHFLIGGKCADG
jgi:hypothetical protein